MPKGKSTFRFPSYGVTVTLEGDQANGQSPDDMTGEETTGFVYFVLHFVKTIPHTLAKIAAQERWDILEALYEDWVNMGSPRG